MQDYVVSKGMFECLEGLFGLLSPFDSRASLLALKGAVSPEISMFCFVCLIVIVISLAKNK